MAFRSLVIMHLHWARWQGKACLALPWEEGCLSVCLRVLRMLALEDPRKMTFSLMKDYTSKRSQQKLCWATNPKTWIFDLLRGVVQSQANLLRIPLSHP